MADDPNQTPAEAPDIAAKRERKEEAERLIDPKSVFMLGVVATRKRWFQELMSAHTRELKDELVAKLQVLDTVVNELMSFINDYKVALRNTK